MLLFLPVHHQHKPKHGKTRSCLRTSKKCKHDHLLRSPTIVLFMESMQILERNIKLNTIPVALRNKLSFCGVCAAHGE